MTVKELLESNPTLIILGTLLSGFLAGVGTINFLEQRDKELRASVLAELRTENATLKVSNEDLDHAVREALKQYVDAQALVKGSPFAAPNANPQGLKHQISQAPRADISRIVRDPIRCLTGVFGNC
jgi:hypothetical protein